MVNRNLYLKIIGSVSLIVLFALLGSVLLITGISYFLSFVCLCVILLITLLLIQWINGKGLICGNESDYPPIQSKPE